MNYPTGMPVIQILTVQSQCKCCIVKKAFSQKISANVKCQRTINANKESLPNVDSIKCTQ